MFGLTIAIPTKNRYDALGAALDSIAAQTVLPQEIIVIDQTPQSQSAEDRMRRLVPQSVRLDYICDPSISGLTVARNVALERTQSEILLFIDDDVTLRPDFIAKLLAAYKEIPEAAGISGVPDNYTAPSGFYRVWSAIFMRGPFHDDRQPAYWMASRLSKPVRVSRMSGGMMSLKTSAIGALRFDKNLRGVADGEDVDFTVRLGGVYFLDPRCRLTHHFHPAGREAEHWTRRHARAWTYLYHRNWEMHKFAYGWLQLGWHLAATAGCASRLSLSPLRSLRSGIAEGRLCAVPPDEAITSSPVVPVG